ncbi:MAG: carbohydrate ABC transporter permease [Clostridia bacterium]|nr:carbohydrate ABC transporter permease [Clostridia bacterium]MBQ8973097.1 carbohydrate ABC transporter permease [Clostridia bacterium]
MVGKKSSSRVVFEVINTVIMLLIAAICLIPIIHVIMSSFSEPLALASSRGLVLWPKHFSLVGYAQVMQARSVWVGYAHTLLYVVVQAVLGVFFTAIAAYVLSRRNMMLRDPFMFLITFTMMFSGGLVPYYVLFSKIHLLNTIWAVILPGMLTPMNIIIMRTFFNSIPYSLDESAKLDGAGAWTILIRIYMPLSKASLAVTTLFLVVAQWNNYFIPMIFLQDRNLWPLQLVLKDLIATSQGAAILGAQGGGGSAAETVLLTRVINYAVIVVGTLPIFCIYPFVQKYFVTGVMIGAIKG